MNPAIVAPDAFDIVDVSLDKALTQDQVIMDYVGFNVMPCAFILGELESRC